MLRALFIAPPGAGKGTQGPRLAELHGVPYVATGDMLREHVASGDELGMAAQSYMDQGGLVPDDLVNEMVRNAVAVPGLPGFVLDGFPRTLTQATAAHDWGRDNDRTFHAVIALVVPEDESVRRMLARSRDSDRSDDVLDTIMHRLKVYDDETEPLLAYYRERGILLEIDGVGTVEDVSSRIDAAIGTLDTSS